MKFGIWNLKTFFSISLGFHLLSLSILTLLFPDFKVDRLPPVHIEVSLLPLISEAKPLPEVIASPAVKTRIRKEEIKAPQKMREEESATKQEQEQKIPAFQTVTKNIPLEEPTLLLPESRKWEIGNEKEEKGAKEPIVQAVNIALPLEEDLTFKGEKGVESQRLHLPNITPSEEPQNVVKQLSLPEGNLVFFQPRYAENPKPAYPQEARKKGYEGEVLLKVEVLANGGVGRVEVKKSSGYEILDRSALTAVKEWKFIPANQGDGSIPCWVNIPIKFQLQ